MHGAVERRGDYQLRDALGRGGMATVYRARHSTSGQTVALKIVRPARLESLRREIRALGRLSHPGIARILDHDVSDDALWYAMELVEGVTLGRVCEEATGSSSVSLETGEMSPWWTRTLESEGLAETPASARAGLGPLAFERVLRIGRRLAAALAYVHGEGLVHRDLKPDNVILRDGDEPILVDFGLVDAVRSSREALDLRTGLTGTAGYMAPEVIRGEAVDARADLYALGCILYEMATGSRPFDAFTAHAILTSHLHAVPPAPSSRVPELPAEFDALVLGLLAKAPLERPGHADDVGRALEALGAAPPPEDWPAARDYLYRPSLVGRGPQRADLRAHLDAAREGAPTLVLIAGESGIGKTRLVNEIGAEAAREGFLVLQGTAQAEGGPALQILREPLQRLADRQPEAVAPFAPVLAPYQPALAALPGAGAVPPELAPEAARLRVFGAFANLLKGLAGQQPVLLALDDLQWSDTLTLDLLEDLIRHGLGDAPLIVLGTYRSEERGPRLARLAAVPGVARLTLHRLDQHAVGAIVSDMLARESPEELEAFVAHHAQGNPFFAAEYVHAVLEAGWLRRDPTGRWGLDAGAGRGGVGEIGLPTALRALVDRRLAGLAPAAARLLAAAAIIGRNLDAPLLREVAELGHDEADDALVELLRRQILEEDRAEGLRFAHDKLREVAEARVEPAALQTVHARAAARLEARGAGPEVLARHLHGAGALAGAATAYAAAGHEAVTSFANHRAVYHLDQALALAAPDDPRRGDWLQDLGAARLGKGDVPGAREAFLGSLAARGVPLPDSRKGLARDVARQILRQLAHRVRAPAVVHDDARSHTLRITRVHQRLVEAYWFDNDPPRMLEAALHAVNHAERAGPSPELARAYATLALATGGSSLHPVAEAYEARARALLADLDDPAMEAQALFVLGVYRIGLGDWARVDQDVPRAEAISERIGESRFHGESLTVKGMSLLYRGRLDEARGAFEATARAAVRSGNPQHRIWSLLGRAECALRSGDVEQGEALLDEARPRVAAAGEDPLERFRLEGLTASARLRAKDIVGATRAADAAEALFAEIPIPTVHYLLEGYGGVVEARVAAGDARAAAAAALRLQIFAGIFPIGRPSAAQARAALARHHGLERVARRFTARARRSAAQLGMPLPSSIAAARGIVGP